MTRRKLIATSLGVAAGASALAVADRLAHRYGLIPPDAGGLYGPGETLTSDLLISCRSLRELMKTE